MLFLGRFLNHRLFSKMICSKTHIKMDSPKFNALFTPELRRLSDLFTTNGFELRIAGGAVRDLLLGESPADVDFATDATPTQMKELFTRENVRMFNKRGEEHGTVTCRINDKENFEITTLRIDVICDGRRAAVEFTKSWEQDAFRRDLTINSLFLDMDGFIHDYTGGVEDIKRRRIVFVGEPVQRLQEDYLRILRYFRFFGRFAILDSPHETGNIDAIIKSREGLKDISGERLWMELHRILVGRMAAQLLRTMLVECGLGPYLALRPDRINEFDRVASANAPRGKDCPLDIQPSTALCALFDSPTEAAQFQDRCKCSNAERTLCELLIQRRKEACEHKADLKFFKSIILDEISLQGEPVKELIKSQTLELIKYIGEAGSLLYKQIQEWEIDKFPVSGYDLLKLAVPKGPKMKCTLRHLFNLWLTSDLKMTREQLLDHIMDSEIDKLEAFSKKKRHNSKRTHSPTMRKQSSKND